MTGPRTLIAIVLTSLALSGCSLFNPELKPSYILENADWSKAKRVELSFTAGGLSPQVVKIDNKRPTILKVRNNTNDFHAITSPWLFRNVATGLVETDSGSIQATRISSLGIKPGQSMSFRFVPDTSGQIDIFCSIDGHDERGVVIVE